MDSLDLPECLHVACDAARQAGAVLEDWRSRFSVREKGRFDMVTDADEASQAIIRQILINRFPDHAFVGEERPDELHAPYAADQPRWIVDPLDGTTNYVHDCPVYAVSIGLEYRSELVLGVIYDPSRDELFHAACDLGAQLNGRPMKTSSAQRLDSALLSTGFPPDLHGYEHILKAWEYFSFHTQSLRRTGSTALNLAYVAAGRHDAFWTHHAHAWDAAAGVVLVREAGGVVSNLAGAAYDWRHMDVLASNGPLHQAMVAALQAVRNSS